MAPRSSWKGFLKLSLVSCPVALYAATSKTDKISFNILNGETGNRLKQQYVDSETGDVVETEDRVKGYEVAKGDYIIVNDEELSDLKIESSDTIEIDKFVPRDAIDPLFVEGHYYLAPDGRVAEEAFSIMRAAMEKRKVVGVAQVVLFGRERVVTLEPRSKGIVVSTLRYDYEVRKDAAYFDDIPASKPAPDMMDLAMHLVDSKLGKFEPTEYKDRYQDAIVSLIRAKQKGEAAPKPAAAKAKAPTNDLMAALRASLGAKPVAAFAPDEPATASPKAEASKPEAPKEPKPKAAKGPVVDSVVHVAEMTVRDEVGGDTSLSFDPPLLGRVAFVYEDGYAVHPLEPHEAFADVDPLKDAFDGSIGRAPFASTKLADKKAQAAHKNDPALEPADVKTAAALAP